MEDQLSGTSLASRIVSGFPLSIGTGIAFESLFDTRIDRYDTARPIPNKINIKNYDELWINLATLFRNIEGSVNKDVFINTTPSELALTIEQEVEVINSLLSNEGMNFCKPVYYYCTYDSLEKSLLSKHVKMRVEKTEGMRITKAKLIDTIKHLRKLVNFKTFDVKLEGNNKNTLIITHLPIDLINYHKFRKLDLLESHTGKLKSRFEWSSKYYPIGDKSLANIPFNKKLLYVLGDKVLIQPSDIRLRNQIHEISVKRNWTPATTVEKIMFDFNLDIKEPFVLEFLSKL